MSDEIEFKFGVPASRRASLARAMERAGGRPKRLQAWYFDTDDERLARRGVTLRLRHEGRQWLQTVKVATADPLARHEDNVVVAAAEAGALPAIDPSRHDGSAVAAALRRALGGAHAADLAPRCTTDVVRTSRRVGSDGARVELALDVGTIRAGERSLPVLEFELELKSGPIEPLLALASRWAGVHRLWLSTISKAERGARLARGDSGAPATKAVPPAVERSASAERFVAACVQVSLAQVLANGSDIAAGGDDPELVHQLRVGLRRLRTALRELAGFGKAIDPAWEAALGRAFGELGADRDRRVVLPHLAARLEAAGAPALPPTEGVVGGDRGRRPPTIVKDGQLQRALLALIAFARTDAPTADSDDAAPDSPRVLLQQRLDRLRRQIERDAGRFAELEPAHQHRVRKRLKRLRYLSEFAAPLFGARRVERYLARCKRAQDALGELTDHRVAADLYRARAEADPHAWFAVGWLAAQQAEATERCAAALRRAAKAAPFWRH